MKAEPTREMNIVDAWPAPVDEAAPPDRMGLADFVDNTPSEPSALALHIKHRRARGLPCRHRHLAETER